MSWKSTFVGMLLLSIVAMTSGAQEAAAQNAPGQVEDASDMSGGYVDDAMCGTCHAELAESYREVGMSRAFGDAATVQAIETFSTPDHPEAGRYFHEASGRWYEMRRSSPEARPVFRRWYEGDGGRPLDLFEAEVDWTLGSGHTSRTYLLQQPSGELFVLPLAWYSQGEHWAMSPGFDQPGHLGLLRRVQRECMFCHNAYPPDVAAQPDRYGDPHLFPWNLPHGTGCQRCHGPGSAHVEAAYMGGLDGEVRSRIVNPGRLDPKLRDDVCEQCHLQPSVALMPTRRFGRRVYSYRPGENLDDYIVYYDPEEATTPRKDRFEINHHPYRLRQSACFLESGREDPSGRLSCLTCHDPHRKVPKPRRAEHYRQACLSCHEVDACGLERMTVAPPQGGGAEGEARLPLHMRGVDPGNCAGCHMPRRRTRDVVHVVMTDHKIQKLPGAESLDESLTTPREEFTPTLVDMDYFLPEAAPTGEIGEVYKAFGVELIGGNRSSFAHLERMLPASGTTDDEPWLQLARGYLRTADATRAEEVLREVLVREPSNVRAQTWLGISLASRDLEAAIGHLEAARDRSKFEDPDQIYNLGVVYGHAGRNEEALATLHRTMELRPLHAAGWMQLGLLQEKLSHPEEAATALAQSLAVEPKSSRARLALARVLLATDRREEAVRQLRHGRRWSDDPEAMTQALKELGSLDAEIESTDGPARGEGRR